MSEKSKNPVIDQLRYYADQSRREADRLQAMIDLRVREMAELRASHRAQTMFVERAEQAIKDIEAVERRRRLYGQEVVQ